MSAAVLTRSPADTTALDARVSVRRGTFALDVAMTVDSGEVVAVLGPNGAGKSTLLNALSGLIVPDRAEVTLFGRTLDATGGPGAAAGPGGPSAAAGVRRVRVDPEHRRIGLLGQDPLLFPHLTALENVAFGRRAQGASRPDARTDALEWLDAVGLADYAERKPAALSGGQQQRVAIARALAARPDLLLLDEPLAALDVQTAARTRRMLVERLRADGTTAIIVTHDVLDAITIADRCAIMGNGRIVDDGPNEAVLGRPSTAFIADLAGMNLLLGRFDGDDRIVVADDWVIRGRLDTEAALPTGTAASATFSPAAVHVRRVEPGEPAAPVATIAGMEPAGAGIRLLLEHSELSLITPHSRVVELDLRIGDHVAFDLDPSDVLLRAIA